jgi:hypothetical protein
MLTFVTCVFCDVQEDIVARLPPSPTATCSILQVLCTDPLPTTRVLTVTPCQG